MRMEQSSFQFPLSRAATVKVWGQVGLWFESILRQSSSCEHKGNMHLAHDEKKQQN
jgi:hypothetical protein